MALVIEKGPLIINTINGKPFTGIAVKYHSNLEKPFVLGKVNTRATLNRFGKIKSYDDIIGLEEPRKTYGLNRMHFGDKPAACGLEVVKRKVPGQKKWNEL